MKHVARVFPIFAVRELDEAVGYYREKLGFSVAWTWGEPPIRAGVVVDDVEIQLAVDPPGGREGPSTVYCHMEGVEEYYEACSARGATITRELAARPWGARDFQIEDPSGNRVGFAEVLK